MGYLEETYEKTTMRPRCDGVSTPSAEGKLEIILTPQVRLMVIKKAVKRSFSWVW